MPLPRWLLTRCAAAALVLFAQFGAASAAPLLIGPVSLEISPRARIAVLNVTNRGSTPVELEAAALSWTQSGGQERQVDTDEILVSPAVVTVPGGATQVFRVALRQPLPPGPERAYRVTISDITEPASSSEAASTGVRIRFIHSLPLYVSTQRAAVPSVTLAPCAAPTGSACVQVDNPGDARTVIRRVAVRAGAWSAAQQPNAVLLAGGSRTFVFSAPAAEPTSIEVDVESDAGKAAGTIPARLSAQ